MANILKDDVQTYVREMIEKEFGSNRIEGKGLSQNRSFDSEDDENGKNPYACDPSLRDVFKTDARFGKS